MSIDTLVLEKVNESVVTKFKEVRPSIIDDVSTEVLKKFEHLRPISIMQGKKEITKVEGLTHHMFEIVFTYVQSRMSLMLVGPAGSGKTHLVVTVADALKMPHYSISVNEQTSKNDFLGYMDATGKVVKTNFRRAYEEGGMFIVDEIDAGNPNILTVINSALSNDFCPFPDGMVKRHKDFLCVCTANTFGEGENAQYIGRNILDSATKDRFATLMIGYDEQLERMCSEKFHAMCWELRQHVTRNNMPLVISTRAIIRLEALQNIKGVDKKLTLQDVKNCLNLNNTKDSNLETIIKKHL